MKAIAILVLFCFALGVSLEDIRTYRIRNRALLVFLLILLMLAIRNSEVQIHALSGAIFFGFFSLFHLAGRLLSSELAIGFGDVKLLSVIAFGYVDVGFRPFEVFLFSLWCALFLYLCFRFICMRKFQSRVPMAPSIFLASGLYLYAPMGLLLPQ